MSDRRQLSLCAVMCAAVLVTLIALLVGAGEVARAASDIYFERWREFFWTTPGLGVEAAWLASSNSGRFAFSRELRVLSYPVFVLVLVLGGVSLLQCETLGMFLSMDLLPESMWEPKGKTFTEILLTWFVILTSLGSAFAAWGAVQVAGDVAS